MKVLIAVLILTIAAQSYSKEQIALMKNLRIEAVQVKDKIKIEIKKVDKLEVKIKRYATDKDKIYRTYSNSKSASRDKRKRAAISELIRTQKANKHAVDMLETKIRNYKNVYAALGRRYVKVKGK